MIRKGQAAERRPPADALTREDGSDHHTLPDVTDPPRVSRFPTKSTKSRIPCRTAPGADFSDGNACPALRSPSVRSRNRPKKQRSKRGMCFKQFSPYRLKHHRTRSAVWQFIRICFLSSPDQRAWICSCGIVSVPLIQDLWGKNQADTHGTKTLLFGKRKTVGTL